jgi:hypothetical protein
MNARKKSPNSAEPFPVRAEDENKIQYKFRRREVEFETAEPAGTINSTGSLVLTVGIESAVLAGVTPTWARVLNGNEEQLFDCDARLSSSADTGQELVVQAPSGFYAGALLQIQSGTFSALP